MAPDLEPVRGPAPDPVRGLYRALGNRSLADLGPTGPVPAPAGGTTVARQLGGGLHLGPDPVPAPAGPASAAPATTTPATTTPATTTPATTTPAT
ncbi:hypothetical protein, partial [Actinophytocola sp.]|uniref:hypothetical protein n=1 Tax=Actinophytocola sp. TaxID=1872138 RepID=UPI002D3A4095